MRSEEKRILSWGEFKMLETKTGHAYPVIELHATLENKETASEDEPEVITRYVMPFRGYFFQVCGTPSGEWDMGNSRMGSPMRGKYDVIRSEKHEIYAGMLSNAIINYVATAYGANSDWTSEFTSQISRSDGAVYNFIEASIDYCNR